MKPEKAIFEEFAGILDTLDAHMVRLHPNFGCESKYTVSVEAKCAGRVVGASRYEAIHYDNGKLVGDRFFALVMIADVGEDDFQNVDSENAKVKMVSGIATPKDFAATRDLYETLASGGLNVGGLSITDRISADEGTTFVIRIVAYEVEGLDMTGRFNKPRPPFMFWELKRRGRRDMTVAAKVIRRSGDDIIHLLWRPIIRRSPPKIRFAKDEIPADFRTKGE